MDGEKYLTAEQLAEALGLPSVRLVKSLTRQKKIPVFKAGYRTRLYQLSKVQKALKKLIVHEVGWKS